MANFNSYGNNPYLNGVYPQQNYIPQVQQPQQQQNNTNIIWIQGGINGAKAHLVQPGQTLALWDSETQTIYIKKADISGVPQPIRILDYTERVQTAEIEDSNNNYATKDDIQSLSAQLQSLSDNITQLRNKYADQRNTHKKGGGTGNVQPSL